MNSHLNYEFVSDILSSLAKIRFEKLNCHYMKKYDKKSAIKQWKPSEVVNSPYTSSRDNASSKLLPQNSLEFKFSVPAKPNSVIFSEKLENALIKLNQIERQYSESSDLPSEQWDIVVKWTLSTAKDFNISLGTVAISLNIFDRFLNTSHGYEYPDSLGIVCACLLIATRVNGEWPMPLGLISASCGKALEDVSHVETLIGNALEWDFTISTASEYLSVVSGHVLDPYYTPSERLAQSSLEDTLLEEAYLDFVISHFQPSSIAFACVVMVMAVFDPHGNRKYNSADVLLLAEKLDLVIPEIRHCVIAFVEFLNLTYN